MNANELINAYLDDSLSKGQKRQLEDWVKASPANAETFAKAVMLHDRLQTVLNLSESSHVVPDEVTLKSKQTPFLKKSPARDRWLYRLAAGFALTLSLIYWIGRPDNQVATQSQYGSGFATLAHAVNAQYDRPDALRLGHRLGAERIRLKKGFIQLRFDSGVEVTLQGPADYEIVAPDQTRLATGLLTANVPSKAVGFRVETPTVQVTDLGTAFGVEMDEDNVSRVSVFSGKVTVSKHGSEAVTSLNEGEALRIDADQEPALVEFDEARFEQHWPISTGIERSTGTFRLIPRWRRLRFARSDERIFVRQEGSVVTLTKPLSVNISKPGKYTKEAQLTPTVLPPGQIVKSLILHYQPVAPRARSEVKRLVGTITFTRPIRGLITQHEELKASARRFHHLPAGEAHPRRELNLNGRPIGDIVELSSDRRTLRLDLASPMHSSDLIRVIVDAELPNLELASIQ